MLSKAGLASVVLAGGLLIGGGTVYAIHSRPSAASREKSGLLTKEGRAYVEKTLGRQLTPKEERQFNEWLATAIDLGYSGDEIAKGLFLSASSGKREGVANALEMCCIFQKMGVVGREKSDNERNADERWNMCSKRIRQIEDGVI